MLWLELQNGLRHLYGHGCGRLEPGRGAHVGARRGAFAEGLRADGSSLAHLDSAYFSPRDWHPPVHRHRRLLDEDLLRHLVDENGTFMVVLAIR